MCSHYQIVRELEYMSRRFGITMSVKEWRRQRGDIWPGYSALMVRRPREADVGAILGFGFPGWTGGPISLIDQIGVKTFVSECDALADRHGERFRPGQMLRSMAAAGQGFY